MRVIEKGHIYELFNKVDGVQKLSFFKDLPAGIGHDGVLCQEVVRVLLDRVIELFNQAPCQETLGIIEHLRAALILFETRAARRLLEKSYAKVGLHPEQLPVDERGHVLNFIKD